MSTGVVIWLIFPNLSCVQLRNFLNPTQVNILYPCGITIKSFMGNLFSCVSIHICSRTLSVLKRFQEYLKLNEMV